MNEAILNRKGVRKVADLPNEVLSLLNQGKIPTVNLTEWLAIDHVELLQNNYQQIGLSDKNVQHIAEKIKAQKKASAMNTTKLVGTTVYELYADKKMFPTILKKLSSHPADAIRCYAPYLIALNDQLTIKEKLDQSKPLVADTHFGVREVVWMALRPEIEQHLAKAIRLLSTWTKSKDENIRRFTTEATRPRGVWCKHIDALKEEPEKALPILEALKNDDSKYVQDSVGNWLNDASKSKPDFVISLGNRWQEESPTKATQKIIKRARRTIDKKT